MKYVQDYPSKELRDYVRCYWSFENSSSEERQFIIMPDGFFDLLICFHEDQLNNIMLSGLWTEKATVSIMPNVKIFGIQFRLLAAVRLIGESIAPMLNDLRTQKADFWGLNELIKVPSGGVFTSLENLLQSVIIDSEKIDPRKDHLLHLIDQSKGNQRVEDYSMQTNWSQRQINRYFQSTFGLSLKSYCTIRKGAASYSQIKRGYMYPQQNYFDQSHFIKEIKRITGATPKELKKNENDRFLQFSIIRDK